MKLILSVTAGPHEGRRFTFDGHDTFLVGRVKDAHLYLSYDDPYFSRRHFVLEVNPPRCRLMDLKSRNGTFLNGERVAVADVKHGDRIKAGHTEFEIAVEEDEPEVTRDLLGTVFTPAAEMPKGPADAPEVPGYEVVKEIGRGGMGVVYRARRLADGVEVALKTIIPGQGAATKQINQFLREAAILKALRHPNIVGFLDVGREGEVIYLAMELMSGPDAGQLVAKGPLDVKSAVRVVRHVLAGLHHAHGQGFVHRDVKPRNVLIGVEGGKKVAKLADFGLARAYESSRISGVTMQGEVGGTPRFMAPEQVTHYRDVKPAADQYAAAATLYTLLTGCGIHDLPDDIGQQLVHITTAEPVPIRSRRSDVPEGLAVVVHQALRREPEERYADVGELRADLRRWA